MILYFSGNVGSLAREKQIRQMSGFTHRCLSYAYMGHPRRDQVDIFEYCLESGVRVFLDSGAFTLQTRPKCTWKEAGAYLKHYAQFVRRLGGQLDAYVTVDWRRDGRTSREAQGRLVDLGLTPLPVFHGETPLEHFRRICEDGYKWVAVSKADSIAPSQVRRFYTTLFSVASGYGVKIHGLSETSANMFTYPFHSVDSTTWLQDSGRGLLLHADLERHKLLRIYVGKDTRPNVFHWQVASEAAKDKVRRQFTAWGFEEKGLLEDHLYRSAYNAKVFLTILAAQQPVPAQSAWAPIL